MADTNLKNQTEEIYHDVKKVARVSDHQDANKLLALGWRLLRVMTGRDEGDYPIFILGWYQEGEPKVPINFNYYL
jgi:hypothetical protein